MSTVVLKNARLEEKFVENHGLVETQTRLVDLHIKAGVIAEIVAPAAVAPAGLEVIDLAGQLVTPSYRESHCHLDKTLLGERWKPLPTRGNIFDQFERERQELPKLKTPLRERAKALLEIYLAQGVTHLRTHVDLFPEVGLTHFETVMEVLSEYRDRLTAEVVLFPQHGLLRSEAIPLLTEALKLGGTHVGGVDPAMVDGDIEASLQATVKLDRKSVV